MKTHRSALKWIAFAVAIGVLIGWVASANEKPRMEKGSIILRGTAISKDDAKAMNRVLKQYDKSLYKLVTYDKGELKKTQGTLSDMVIGQKLISEIAKNAKKSGFTQYAIQLGFLIWGVPHASPTPGMQGLTVGIGHTSPTPGVSHVAPAKAQATMDSEELVKRLKPIFEKYSNQ